MVLKFRKGISVVLAVALSIAMVFGFSVLSLQYAHAEELESPLKMIFEGHDASDEWAYFYSIDSRTEKIADLKITLQDEDGKEIPADAFDLKIEHTWYDETEGKDRWDEVSAPYGLDPKDYEAGFTEFLATATLKDDPEVIIRHAFMIVDVHSLNFVCPVIEIKDAYIEGGWRMVNWFTVDINDLQPPVVSTHRGDVHVEGTDYDVTYFTRVGDLESMETDREKVLAGDQKLDGIPETAGEYVVHINGKGDCYGENIFLLDVTGEKEPGPGPEPAIPHWVNVDGRWQYIDPFGNAVTGWGYINNVWYLFDESGWMQTGWKYVDGAWYFLADSGAMQTGWLYDGNVWYYLNYSGAMQTGWGYIDNIWYYFATSGAMQTGWQYIDNDWYFLYASGAMAANQWIGNYYVGYDGRWCATR